MPLISDETCCPRHGLREEAHQKNRRTVFRITSFDYVPGGQDSATSTTEDRYARRGISSVEEVRRHFQN